MPFSRPTLTALRAQISADIAAGLPGSDALLRYSNLNIVGEAVAGMAAGHYGYLDWSARQQVPFTATDEYLEGWAALKGVTRKPATPATGTVTFAGTNGRTIPAGAAVARSDGLAYVVIADVTVAAGIATATVRAVVPGAAGNGGVGVVMTLGVGVSGVTAAGSTATPLTGGAEIETDDALRSRMLQVYAAPSQGGSRTDYVEWALAVPGVTRCWVVPSGMGPGTIVLLFMMDDAEAGHGGFPQGTNGCATGESRDTAATGDQLALANAIFATQPVTALVYAVAPLANTLTLTLAGIAGANTATRAAIAAAVRAALRIGGVPGGTTNVSVIEAAIAGVTGTAGFVLTGIAASAGAVAPGAAGNITSNAGALPVLGTITYV